MKIVRPLNASEATEVAAWAARLPLLERYGTTPEGLARQFVRALEQGETLLTTEDARGVPRGAAWIMPRGAFGRSAYLRLIVIHPEHSGAGLGSRLLLAAEEQASQAGDALFLLVSDFNTRAQQFYRRHGYTQVGALPGYVIPDITELIFWKRL